MHHPRETHDRGVIMHHDKRRHKHCRKETFFQKKTLLKIIFLQFLGSSDSRFKMSSNGRCHRVQLAKTW